MDLAVFLELMGLLQGCFLGLGSNKHSLGCGSVEDFNEVGVHGGDFGMIPRPRRIVKPFLRAQGTTLETLSVHQVGSRRGYGCLELPW